MHWLVWQIIGIFVNSFIIISIVDIILMGNFKLKFSKKSKKSFFMIMRENCIDIQAGNTCSGYAIAYILRHYGISVKGDEIYAKLPNKMNNGCVYPKEVKRMLEKYGFYVKYCVGNLHALRNEVSKGTPVIVLIKTRKDKNWLHYVPVVGYDENNIFIAESFAELVNCNENSCNRKIHNEEFKKLWNTSMLKMPLYTHTFFSIN
ncbi:MAG: peptidase [Lachnospiraceae bacterium]|nr:peptidase [Lachnospiraceae bacterium]